MFKKVFLVFLAAAFGFVVAFVTGSIFFSYITYLFVNDRTSEIKRYLSRIWSFLWIGTMLICLVSFVTLGSFSVFTQEFFGPPSVLFKIMTLTYGFYYFLLAAFVSFSIGVFWIQLRVFLTFFYKWVFTKKV